MPSPRPTPTALRTLRGNPGKRPLPANEPHPRPGVGRPPAFLDVEARREWNRIGRRLERLGLLTEIDGRMLAVYCVAYSRWVSAEDKIREFGMITLSPDRRFPMPSPYLPIANKAMEQMQRAMMEFGMSPASRTKVSTATVPSEEDEKFARLFLTPQPGAAF